MTDWYIGGRSDDGSHVDIRQPGRGTAVCIGVPVRTASVVIEEHNREVTLLEAEIERLREIERAVERAWTQTQATIAATPTDVCPPATQRGQPREDGDEDGRNNR